LLCVFSARKKAEGSVEKKGVYAERSDTFILRSKGQKPQHLYS
jgi:hypothetical protein